MPIDTDEPAAFRRVELLVRVRVTVPAVCDPEDMALDVDRGAEFCVVSAYSGDRIDDVYPMGVKRAIDVETLAGRWLE